LPEFTHSGNSYPFTTDKGQGLNKDFTAFALDGLPLCPKNTSLAHFLNGQVSPVGSVNSRQRPGGTLMRTDRTGR